MWLLRYSTSLVVAMPKLKWSDYYKGPDLIPRGTRKSFLWVLQPSPLIIIPPMVHTYISLIYN